jgi:SWI/SNF-related matrix-associated actin-dependent regulator of chromatin subfamily A-like protein 1
MQLTLDPHQVEAVKRLVETKRGGLFDQPRVGKTAPAIYAACKVGSRVLVLCPAVAIANWEAQIPLWTTRYNLIWEIESYDTYARNEARRHQLETVFAPDVVILDEAHYLKTRSTQRTKAVYGERCKGDTLLLMNATYVWALTGTPMPNHAGELWTHFRALAGEALSYMQWLDRYCITQQTNFGLRILGNKREALPELRAKVQAFARRLTYASVHGADKAPLVWNVVPVSGDLTSLVDLEQHDKPTREALKALIEGRKPTAEEEIALSKWRRVVADVKAPLVVRYISDYLDADPKAKVLALGWHQDALRAIAGGLEDYGASLITGTTTRANRELIRERFQMRPDKRVVVGNILACGTAIDLSAATLVVMAELVWSPGDNEQAAMRSVNRAKAGAVPVDVLALAGSSDGALLSTRTRKIRMQEEVYSTGGES